MFVEVSVLYCVVFGGLLVCCFQYCVLWIVACCVVLGCDCLRLCSVVFMLDVSRCMLVCVVMFRWWRVVVLLCGGVFVLIWCVACGVVLVGV